MNNVSDKDTSTQPPEDETHHYVGIKDKGHAKEAKDKTKPKENISESVRQALMEFNTNRPQNNFIQGPNLKR